MKGGVSFKIKITPPARPASGMGGPGRFNGQVRRRNGSQLIPESKAA